MVALIVRMERPDLEEQRDLLIIQNTQNQSDLLDIENKILEILALDK